MNPPLEYFVNGKGNEFNLVHDGFFPPFSLRRITRNVIHFATLSIIRFVERCEWQ